MPGKNAVDCNPHGADRQRAVSPVALPSISATPSTGAICELFAHSHFSWRTVVCFEKRRGPCYAAQRQLRQLNPIPQS